MVKRQRNAELVQMFMNGTPANQIAKTLGISRERVRQILVRNNLPSGANRPVVRWTKKMISKLGEMTDREIAEYYGISNHLVAHHRRRLGIAYAKKPKCVDKLLRIRKMRKNNNTWKNIAKCTGYSSFTYVISFHNRWKNWQPKANDKVACV